MSIDSNVEQIIPVERAQLERAFIASAEKLTTLYSLSATFNHITDLLEAAEDPEGTANLELELDRIAGDITHKAESIAGLVAHLEGLAIVRKAEANRLRQRADVCEARAERLRSYLCRNMESIGQKRIETDRFTLTVRSYPHVEVSDPAEVPSEFHRVKVIDDVDKKAILATFRKNGEIVPGTEVVYDSKVLIA